MSNENHLNEELPPPPEEMSAIEAIRSGLEQVKQGKTKPAKEVFDEMRKKLNNLDKPQQQGDNQN